MKRIKLWAFGTSIAFYALLIDMCNHLSGWRFFEPFLFFALFIVMAVIAKVLFEDEPAVSSD